MHPISFLKDAGSYFLKNGTTGAIIDESGSAYTVFETVIDVAGSGCLVRIYQGEYDVGSLRNRYSWDDFCRGYKRTILIRRLFIIPIQLYCLAIYPSKQKTSNSETSKSKVVST